MLSALPLAFKTRAIVTLVHWQATLLCCLAARGWGISFQSSGLFDSGFAISSGPDVVLWSWFSTPSVKAAEGRLHLSPFS